MSLLSSVYKSSNIIIDENNRVIVNVEKFEEKNNKTEETIDKALENDTKDTKTEDNTVDYEALSKRILEEANNDSYEIIENARKEAKQIFEDSRSDGFKEGYENGLEEGKEKGHKESLEKSKELIEKGKNLVAEGKKEKEETLASLEPEIVETINQICESILNSSIKFNKDLIYQLLKESLSDARILDKAKIRTSSEDFEEIKSKKQELEKLIDPDKTIEIALDENLKIGDCIIETDLGYINCSLGDKIKTLKTNLYLLLNK